MFNFISYLLFLISTGLQIGAVLALIDLIEGFVYYGKKEPGPVWVRHRDYILQGVLTGWFLVVGGSLYRLVASLFT